MRWALVVMSLVAASAAQAKDTQAEDVCGTLRQMAELAAEAGAASRAVSDLGKSGLDGATSEHPVVVEAGIATAKALALANEAAELTRSLVQTIEELCPSALEPT